MSCGTRFSIAVGLALLVIATPNRLAYAAPPERSVSTSRQFIVYGADAQVRGALCELAERTKKEALGVLYLPDGWRTPIVVHVQAAPANQPELPPARLTFSQTGFGLKLQLDLTLGAEANAPAVERELLRALLLEIMYRAEPNTPAGTPYVEPPHWLVEGTLALIAERDRSALAERLSTVTASGKLIALSDFLRQTPALLESPSRVLYRAYAAAFVSMLTQTPDGRERLARFITDLPRATNDPLADLQRHFPALGDSPQRMQKTWETNLSRLAAPERYRLMTCAETEQQLTSALRIEIGQPGQAAKSYALEEFPQFIRSPAAPAALKAAGERLLVLAGRAHMLHQPVIREYQEIARLLEKRKTKRIERRLAEARSTRELLTRRMGAIDDYMNWYEATQLRTASGAFREYLKAAEFATERPLRRRRDPISVYLDAMEAQF